MIQFNSSKQHQYPYYIKPLKKLVIVDASIPFEQLNTIHSIARNFANSFTVSDLPDPLGPKIAIPSYYDLDANIF